MRVDEKAVQYATQRVTDFWAVQKSSVKERVQAIELLYESLNFDDDAGEEFVHWAEAFGVDNMGDALIGLLVGLFMIQYICEEAES